MKIASYNPYINFASFNQAKKPEISLEEEEILSDFPTAKKDNKKKVIKYAVAAAAVAAVVIGGIYYLRRGKKIKETPDINLKKEPVQTGKTPNEPPQTKPNEVNTKNPKENIEQNKNPETVKKNETVEKQEKADNNSNINKTEKETNAVNKNPFDMPEEYFDFANLKGEREDNIVRQFENGKPVREFYSEDNKNLTLFSQFDSESGFRLHDIEFSPDRKIKTITKYSDNKFSEMTVYEEDGVTVKQIFDSEESALLYQIDHS